MKHWTSLLVAALFAINPFNLNAQEFDLHVYLWKPTTFPTTNILVSWDGPCGTYTVLTNSDLNTTNWGVYSTVDKHYWLNQQLMSVYTIGNEQLFFNIVLAPDANQEGCPETQMLIITHPYDKPAYTNQPTRFDTYTIGPENRTHQWFFEGSPISGATNMNYTIDAVTPADEGEYFLVASSSSQNLTSQIAYLTVLEEDFPLSEPSPPEPPGMSSQQSMTMDAMGLLEWYYDPYAIINPIIQLKVKKLEAEQIK